MKSLVIGGSSGLGLALALTLAKEGEVVIVARSRPLIELPPNISFKQFDLSSDNFSFFDQFDDINTLIISAGVGYLSRFEDLSEDKIIEMMQVNSIAPIRIIKHFYNKILSQKTFYTAVIGSISGFMSSPWYAVYGASKASLKIFIESINVELKKSGSPNVLLNVSPGSIVGTSFNGAKTDLSLVLPLANEIVRELYSGNDLFIPQYQEIFKEVLARYHEDFRAEGSRSYDYKERSGRVKRQFP